MSEEILKSFTTEMRNSNNSGEMLENFLEKELRQIDQIYENDIENLNLI